MKVRDGLLLLSFLGLAAQMTFTSCAKKTNEVVVYVSEDQVFSQPILEDFQRQTGIRVKAIYDTEEAKGTGLMNRLLAEKKNPRADVYWANEPIRAEFLKQRGIATPYLSPNARTIPENMKDPKGYWTGFSARARVFIVNRSVKHPPTSIEEYTAPRWKGRAALANPLFGTTAIQFAVLLHRWGEARVQHFWQNLIANGVRITTSNGESADFVARGEADWALVDSDDAINRMRQGLPVTLVLPDQGPEGMGTLVLPNAVLLIKNGPHPENGKRLIDFLLSPETERKLAFADCAQIPLHPGVETPAELKSFRNMKVLSLDYTATAQLLPQVQKKLQEWQQ